LTLEDSSDESDLIVNIELRYESEHDYKDFWVLRIDVARWWDTNDSISGSIQGGCTDL